jgi:tetratricopeptide (TPR) repeat protein
MNARWLPAVTLLAGFCAGSACTWWYLNRYNEPPTIKLVSDAQHALRIGDNGEAERLAKRALARASDSTAAMLVAGEAAAKSNRLDDAVAYYAMVPDTGSEAAFRALAAKADALFHLGRFRESEAAFLRTLEIEPHNELMLHRFTGLLDAGGRRWDSRPYLLTLVKLGRFTFQELCLLANFNEALVLGPVIEKALKAVPDDPGPLLAEARVKLLDNNSVEATEMLWKVVGANPSNLEAQGLLGTVLAESAADREFHRWRIQLPENADRHPAVWYARGLWAEQNGQLDAAARCYWEALRIEPDHHRANYQAGLVLKSLGRSNLAQGFSRRAEMLAELNNEVHVAYSEGIQSDRLGKIGESLENLGRLWEAWAWNVALVQRGTTEAAESRDRLKKMLDRDNPPQTLGKYNPAQQQDLSHLPFPNWSPAQSLKGNKAEFAADAGVQPAFVESTREAGIDFTYFNGDDLESKGMKIHQTLGGGIAVIDYDGDGWPDLHFTQGARDVLDFEDSEHFDRLYRNLGNGRFADVTAAAGVADHRYSQGPAVGDYDSDGFPDLFISNIGKSRLYRNNGDGTFADVTAAAGVDLNHWSTSALLADLNGDGHPDIYNVTYLRGGEVYHTMCGQEAARACTPIGFDAENDYLLLNLGDGTFRDATSEAGLAAVTGKGLGILAADFDRSGRLSLVVANDTEVNFFLANQTARRGGLPRFEERGVSNGTAYDRDGLTQANMGIAADDCNGDGLLDLYITTFWRESKTLRIQQPGQFFVDMTREANLRDAGYEFLGFGTQFLDGELDGLPDLVVANGHVDDFTYKGIPFEMRPQYFRNLGGGKFSECAPARLGPYFEARHLGRCLVRLDWNRDGREDFAVSHLNAPSALVTNDTAGGGHFLTVRLVAVNSARDAVGAIATLTAGGFSRVRELTGGDGYFASNQRQLVFGLGNHRKVDRLVIQWPSGTQQEFVDLAVDREYVLIENRDSPVLLVVDR